MATLFRRLGYLLRRSRREAELREEIESHRALRQAALERDGLSPDDAALASRRSLGNTLLAVEETRDVWIGGTLDRLQQDVRAAFRGLRRSPGFTLVAILTLALGIGANAALFSIFNSLILRPLPVRDPGRLALLSGGSWTYPIWEEIDRIGGRLFDGTFAWSGERFDLSRGGQTELVDGAYASGRMFQVLGVSAERGRMLEAADDRIGSQGTAVISHRFWQQRLGGEGDVVGRAITVERVPFTIVGVMPHGFFGPDVGRTADVIVPFAAERRIRGADSVLGERSTWWLEVMVRLKPHQALEAANAAIRGVQPHIRAATLPDWSQDMLATYLEEPFTLMQAASGKSDLRSRFETPLAALMIAVGLVLLVACANIASLLLARALARRHELSVRLAIGASRWRLARLLFTESLVVAVAGAALALVFAQWSGGFLVAQLNTWRGAVFLDLSLDWRVLAFTAALACLSAIVASLAPVIGASRVAPGEALREAGRGISGDRRFAVRGALVVAQLALSLVLIAGAGLFVRTFASLSRVSLGFAAERLLVADVRTGGTGAASPEERRLAFERLREAAATVPGVRSAALSNITPVSGQGWNNWVGDSPAPPKDRGQMTWMNATTPGWFATMGIPVLDGRDFDDRDRAGRPLVAIVNQSFARRFLPHGRAVGQLVILGGGVESRYRVVGVVGDAVYNSPRQGMVPTTYLPVTQRHDRSTMSLTMAVAPGQLGSVRRTVAAELTRIDPSLALTFRTFDQLVDATVARERLVALLSAFFGGLALLLAALGLYGMVTHAVRERRVEIGVHMAFGAEPRLIVGLVLRRVGALIAAGLALGTMAGIWASRFVKAMLFGLEAGDPVTFAGAAAALVLVALVAAWVPARRAGRLDPVSVLRES